MSIIVPYDEILTSSQGAFINRDGKIMYTNGKHEEFAEEYCNGLKEKDEKIIASLPSEQIEIYDTTKLTSNQLKLYKEWLLEYGHLHGDPYSDFLVYLLKFDKVESGSKKTIITTEKQPHIRFYNYYLMEWYISQDMPLKLNRKTKKFEFEDKSEWYDANLEDREAKEEIEGIKKQIKLKDRPLFFR